MPHVAVIDNYDSFTQNVVHALSTHGARCTVYPNDAIAVEDLLATDVDGLVISAGPCTPARAGISLALVAALEDRQSSLPLLGLCLGHQTIAMHAGGMLRRATEAMHGAITPVRHDDRGLFTGFSQPLEVARYNSLVVSTETWPSTLEASAWDANGDVMALRHRVLPHVGWQFHPESWLCPEAAALLGRWVQSSVAHPAEVLQGAAR